METEEGGISYLYRKIIISTGGPGARGSKCLGVFGTPFLDCKETVRNAPTLLTFIVNKSEGSKTITKE
jgi:hypothetical protein